MPQKFLHLNCFFTCGITASNLATFWSIWFAVGGCTRAPKISASFVRTRRSSNAFASVQLFDNRLVRTKDALIFGARDEAIVERLRFGAALRLDHRGFGPGERRSRGAPVPKARLQANFLPRPARARRGAQRDGLKQLVEPGVGAIVRTRLREL